MTRFYLGLAIILCAAVGCLGQSAGTRGSAAGTSAASAHSGRAISLESATNIQAELQKQIDVRKAQPGDQVILKTTKAVKQNGETVIPKGTSLIGHVTGVSRQGKGNANSSIGVLFDRLEGNGISSPITATVMSITSASSTANLGNSAMSDVSGSSTTSGSASVGGSGGLLGGVGGAVAPVLGTATQTVGGLTNSASQTLGTVTGTAGQAIGSTTSGLGRTISGIQISNAVGGSANSSTTLSAAGKDLKLEKGVTFQLQLSSPAGN